MRNLAPLFLVVILSGCSGAGLNFLKYNSPDTQDFNRFDGTRLAAPENTYYFAQTDNHQLPSADLWKIEEKKQHDYSSPEDFMEKNASLAFLVIKSDTIIYENYFNGHARNMKSQVFSVTKSFTSALVGIAISEGHIKGIDQPVSDFIPEFGKGKKSEVTINHLLQMTSGLAFYDFKNIGKLVRLYYGNDQDNLILSLGLSKEPGEHFGYQSAATQVLAMCLQKATGQRYAEYLYEKIWEPLGMEFNGMLIQDKNGMAKAYAGLSLTAIDLAKFGRLYLNNGNWNGKQIIPEEWVKAIWSREQEGGTSWRYSYHWWRDTYCETGHYDKHDYFAGGFRGQVMYISPEDDMIIIRLGLRESKTNWPLSMSKLALLPDLQENNLKLEQPESLVAAICGSYTNDAGEACAIMLDNDRVMLEDKSIEGGGYYELEKSSRSTFVDKGKKLKVVLNFKDNVLDGFFLEQGTKIKFFNRFKKTTAAN